MDPMKPRVNLGDLGAAVAQDLGGLSSRDGTRAVVSVLEAITRELAAGNDVTVTNFGTFQATLRSGRSGLNPRTGESLQIPDRIYVNFHPSDRLQQLVRNGDPEIVTIRKIPPPKLNENIEES